MVLNVEIPPKIEIIAPHREAMRATPAGLASYLQNVLTQRLTALVAGVQDVKAVGGWAHREHKPQPDKEARLRVAFHIVRLLEQVESTQTIRAWFVGMNPVLGGRSPASVIASAEDEADFLLAFEAAYGFLAE